MIINRSYLRCDRPDDNKIDTDVILLDVNIEILTLQNSSHETVVTRKTKSMPLGALNYLFIYLFGARGVLLFVGRYMFNWA
jgi:hypothetical protein